MSQILVIDLGGSTIDYVNFDSEKNEVFETSFINSNSVDKHNLSLVIEKLGVKNKVVENGNLVVTGGHSQKIPKNITIKNQPINLHSIYELEAIGEGGLFLSSNQKGLIISMGTGTAMVVSDQNSNKHVGGTGIGGGSFLGLCRAILKINDFETLEKLSRTGNLKNIDLSIGEVVGGDLENLPSDAPASNFAKYSDQSSKPEDVALGVAEIVGQGIALLALEKAQNHNQENIILGGKLTKLRPVVRKIQETAKILNKEVFIPNHAEFMTAIGAARIYSKIR